MTDLKILSGGAANGLVTAVSPEFTRATGLGISGDFGAVGGMRDRLLAGEAVDLIILTRAIVVELGAGGHVDVSSITDLGQVATGIAVRDRAIVPDVSTADGLREVLLAADAIYFPDPAKATAGIHFAKVLAAFGITEATADRLKTFPNGQAAMSAMAASHDENPIGCTQITEILNTDGVTYAGDLPRGHDLMTTYTAGVTTNAIQAKEALKLVEILSAPDIADLRTQIGFCD